MRLPQNRLVYLILLNIWTTGIESQDVNSGQNEASLANTGVTNSPMGSLSFLLRPKEASDVEDKVAQNEVAAKRRQFGKRLISVDRFKLEPKSGLEWIGYFYEEAFVPVLQTKERLMVDCTVSEVRQEWEQMEAMKYFGRLMEVVPLSLPDMVQLVTLCGTIHSEQVSDQDPKQPSGFSFGSGRQISDANSRRPPFSSVILPGTLWCGMKDRADRYELLGDNMELDRCCRAHDHCPIKLGSFENRYGVSNSGFTTKSHCLCELEFFRCLKGTKSSIADMIGNFYFDVLNSECLQQLHRNKRNFPLQNQAANLRGPNLITSGVESPYKCVEWDANRKCRFWEKNPNYINEHTKNQFRLQY